MEFRTASTEEQQMAQALWDIYAALGNDTVGDPTPAAMIAGMGVERFCKVVVNAARETQQDYDAALEKIDKHESFLRRL